jgi:iron complex transport system permease protein
MAVLEAPSSGLTRGPRRRSLWVLALAALVALAAALSAAFGSYAVSLRDAMAVLLNALGLSIALQDEGATAVLLVARWPRVLLGSLVGASLGVAGAVMQGVFRNPLADPGLCGVSSGAALGAVLMLVFGGALGPSVPPWLAPYLVTLGSFVGGVAAVLLVVKMASHGGRTSTMGLVLGGVAVSAIGGAAIGWLTFLATDAQLRSITFWSLGSLGNATWKSTAAALPLFLIPLVLAPTLARALDALLLGEAEAGHLGFRVERIRRLALVVATLSVGTSVALCGAIGFVGLVAPHLARMLVGALHRHVLPASALLGAALLLAADLAARVLVAPAELPLGVVTATLGAPVFLALLRGVLRGAP